MIAASTASSAHVCTPTSDADAARAITNIRQRLKRWELDHLRQHSAELADRLEAAQAEIDRLTAEVERAWHTAESWREDAMELVNELGEMGQTVGLTQTGHLVAIKSPVDAVVDGAGGQGGGA